jgi:hypothetical protein
MGQPMSKNAAPDLRTSEKGWVRADGDIRFWIACPPPLTDERDNDDDPWAEDAAAAWWELSERAYTATAIGQLAAMFRYVQEHGYARVPCHQIWIYLRDPAVPPLPVHIGIWKTHGDRDQQLRQLSGADDPASSRPADVAEFSTDNLGTGVRALHYRMRERGVLAMLGYAFRAEIYATDIQIMATTRDLRHLATATPDIEAFIETITVFSQDA